MSTHVNSTIEDSCRSNVGESDDDTCETSDVDPELTPSIAKMGSSARRSKFSRFRRGRQRDRRALQANTEKDLELLRRFEVEIDATRARQRTRE